MSKLKRAFSASVLIVALVKLQGCCGCSDPLIWKDPGEVCIPQEGSDFELSMWVNRAGSEVRFEATSSDAGLIAWVEGASTLRLTPQPGWKGSAEVELVASDECENGDTLVVPVRVDDDCAGDTLDTGDTNDPDDTGSYPSDPCSTVFSYRAQGSPEAVFVAGAFNEWSSTATPLTLGSDNVWSVELELEPGEYAYKFVEVAGSVESWNCDPEAPLKQCDSNYKDPLATTWTRDCNLGDGTSCNSLQIVEACDKPTLTLTSLNIDRTGRGVQATVTFRAGSEGAAPDQAIATLDEEPIDSAWDGERFVVDMSGLDATRHTLRFNLLDENGAQADEVYVPFWLDDRDWQGGMMYYAFVDRVKNGDTSIDSSEGATEAIADYMGGDFQGIIDMLPYLDELGVTVIWLSNFQDNAEGAYDGKCSWNYSAYHGYWPDSARQVEEHYGQEDKLAELIDKAHGRNMRVMMDWVANHVHLNHPYYTEHSDDGWFNDENDCNSDGGWDNRPETCWFDSYLPDINFYNSEPLHWMVEDGIWWIKNYEIDGYRVDGAKHVPHSVVWNLASRLEQEVEHHGVGGDEDFYTVGETFTQSREWILSYIHPNELDAQFDFPLYYAVRDTFLTWDKSFLNLRDEVGWSRETYGSAIMSAFLGNHDVSRFTTFAGMGPSAESDDYICQIAEVSTNQVFYQELMLAWSFLLTQPGLPLVYYGDELGIPGYKDPGDRHPFWWYSSALETPGEVDIAAVAGGLYHADQQAQVLYHVQKLGQARRNHPALYEGTETEWYMDSTSGNYWAYARVSGSDSALVILNRGDSSVTMSNGLSYTGLPSSGTYEDLLSGATYSASGDNLTLTVPGRSSMVLVPR